MNKLQWAGWVIAMFLFAALMLQRSCQKMTSQETTKTIEVPGDRVYSTLHDTVLKWKTDTLLLHPKQVTLFRHDTIVRLVYKVIHDTVRADNVDVAITDSLMPDSSIDQKVSIKNNRPITQTVIAPNKFKLFVGFQVGLGLDLKTALFAPTLTFITNKEAYYSVGFDFVNKMPVAGMSWKIHL